MIRVGFLGWGSGWADVSVANGDIAVKMMASYWHDSYSDIARAAVTIMRGAPKASFVTDAEPVICEWVFEREEGDFLKVTGSSDSADSDLSFHCSFRSTPREFGMAVLAMLEGTVKSYGERRFEKRWQHAFPEAQYQELRSLLAQSGVYLGQ